MALSILNPNPVRVPGPSLLHHLVPSSSVDNIPALEYLSADNIVTSFSFEQLDRVTDVLAAEITRKIPNAPKLDQFVIPVLIPQCPELYIGLLAILKAGGAFCPLNLDAPPDRIGFILKDVQACLVMTTPELSAKFSNYPVELLAIDSQDALANLVPLHNPQVHRCPSPDDLAYVMYTSGSTGTPKGVGIPHSAATQALLAHDEHIPCFRRFLQFASPTFDVSVFEIFFPLFRTVTLVSCAREIMLDDLPRAMRKMEVDACELTPTVAGGLLKSRESVPGLKLLLTIGEMLTSSVVTEFGAGNGREGLLWAMYGPTEATIHCTLQTNISSAAPVGSIGIPLATVSAYILEVPDDTTPSPDAEPRILPLGETGELAVGGHQLATGYINRPEQTAAAFIETSFGGRLYRTGDRARITADGRLECLGRIADGQVKLRGQRIELGEVEAAALRAVGVQGAVAAVVAGNLVVFCAAGEAEGVEKMVLGACRAWLPRFMVPGDVVVMGEFPRLPSGKVDRKGLAKGHEEALKSDATAKTTFVDELDRQLRVTAQEVLGVAVDSTSVLASLGMDSLRAIRYASSLRSLGLDVGALDVLDAKTVADLHHCLSRGKGLSKPQTNSSENNSSRLDATDLCGTNPELGGKGAAIESVMPCTPTQVSMLVETARNPQAYCNWVELSFPSEVGFDQIHESFQSIARRNAIFRTGFTRFEGTFAQVIWNRLEEWQVVKVDEFERDFQLDSDESRLRPFRIQVRDSRATNNIRALVCMHHSLYDGWSVDLLLMDLNALLRGSEAPSRLPFQCVAEYQLSTPSKAINAARQFWAESLLGFQPSSPLQLRGTLDDSCEMLIYEAPLGLDPAGLQDMIRRLQIGPQSLFQAALFWLLGGLFGADDVVMGTVSSGRTIGVPGVEEVMGPCLATLPLRMDLSQIHLIRDLLTGVHAANRALLPYSMLTLAEVKKVAAVLPGQSLYDVLFVYQESLYSQRLGTTHLVKQVDRQDYLETGLLFEVEPTADDFKCRITYHSAQWPARQVRLLFDHFKSVVAHFITDTGKKLSSTRGCFPSQLLSHYNAQPSKYSGCVDLAALVRLRGTQDPGKPAICFATAISDGGIESQTMTFRDLDITGNRIARYVLAHDATRDSAVAIVMEKSFLLYAGILGILKAGCAYLPLLPSTPVARTALILRQADVRLCLTDTRSKEALQRLDCRFLDLASAKLDRFSPDNPVMDSIPADGSGIANIIYTSGTTGIPKGVCITHRNIASNLDVLSRIYPVGENSRLLQSCSQAFDVSVFEIFFAWTRGMCLCAAVNDVLFEDLSRAIRMLRVTHLSLTPTVAALVGPVDVPNVEFLVTSGEAMTEEVARKWNWQLYQGYGPSEMTNICTVKKMGPRDAIRHLGHSFDNTSSVVLYPGSHDIVPLGAVGELCFGGDQVAGGYLNMPDLTSEKFIHHPGFGRLYRSGDLGRILPDGSLMIIGRLDDQVKIRGQRVELNEINATIMQKGVATQSVTLMVNRPSSASQQLAAFYVPVGLNPHPFSVLLGNEHSDLAASSGLLWRIMRSKLPSYMIPTYLIPIAAVPLTPAGKVDRGRLYGAFQKLTEDDLAVASSASDLDEGDFEWDDRQRGIARVVSEALGVEVDRIGLWTPLPSLGLDSLSAITVARLLKDSSGFGMPLSVILQNPSVAQLSEAIAEHSSVTDSPSQTFEAFTPSFRSRLSKELDSRGLSAETVLPCTPLQEAMLVSSMDQSSYVNKMVFRLRCPSRQMKEWWSAMIKRHGILRACFVTTEDPHHAIAQVVLKNHSPKWQELDMPETFVNAYVDEQALKLPTALDSYQPSASFAIMQDNEVCFLSFVCHHALYDGEAISRLLVEVEKLGRGEHLPPPTSYERFLAYSLSLAPSTDEFWRDHFHSFTPTLLEAGLNSTNAGQHILADVLDLRLSDLENRLRAIGISMLTAVQTAWAGTIAAVLKTPDVCFGNVFSGRSIPLDGIGELVAPCFNTLPVRIDTAGSGAKRGVDIMRRVQATGAEMLKYQFTPLRRIQRSWGGRRLFNTLVLLQPPVRPLDDGIWQLERDDGDMDFPLACEVVPSPSQNSLMVQLHFQGTYISSSDAQLICEIFTYVLDHLSAFPSSQMPSYDTFPSELQSGFHRLDLQHDTPVADSPDFKPADDREWSTVELEIRSVFSKLSSIPRKDIGHDTTIFRIGLDSISAVQVASQLRRRGWAVSASDVLEHPTCAELAVRIAATAHTSLPRPSYSVARFRSDVWQQLERQGVVPETLEAILPCTPLQCGMLSESIRSKGRHYFNYVDFRLAAGAEKVECLARAWAMTVATTPMLRTGFAPVDHTDTSFAMVQYPTSLPHNNIATLKDAVPQGFYREKWRLDTARRAFDALDAPPWSVAIVETEMGIQMHLAIHHALYDAQSLRCILDNLAKTLAGRPIKMSPSTDDIVAEIFGQASTVSDSDSNFWKSLSHGTNTSKFPILTPLRVDQASNLVQSRMASRSFQDVEAAARMSGVTIQSLLQASWTRVLSAYLGDASVAFGIVLSGRNTETTAEASFPCITTLPVIATNETSNRGLVRQMMKYNASLQKFQHTSLSQIHKWLGCADTGLFDTLLVYQKLSTDGDVVAHPWQLVDENAAVDYPVSLEIEPVGSELRLSLTFHDSIMPAEQAMIVLAQFDAALTHITFHPDGIEDDLSHHSPDLFCISPAEEPELPSEERFLHHFVEFPARLYPNRPALRFITEFTGSTPVFRDWTFAELNTNGNKVAALLSRQAALRSIVAVCFDKCPEAYFAILGVLKAGCAFVVLDPGAPPARKEFIVRDSGAAALLSDKPADELGFKVDIPVLVIREDLLDDKENLAADLFELQSRRAVDPNYTCYCLYTSGTTGTPKGCEITHANAVQALLAFQRLFAGHWDASSRWLQFAALHFDVSVLEQYWPWSVGLLVVSAPRNLLLDDLPAFIRRLAITHLDLTPSLARLLEPDEVPSLRRGVFITGGETLKAEMLERWGDVGVVHNFYGPTEATIGVTSFPCVPRRGRASNIGRPFANVGTYVLCPGTEAPVLRGGVGELCVAGRLVGKGYLRREELTQEKFPTLQRFGERVYRTGDLVRLLHDGCFDFLGRADDQVKLRGQRLEIGEIDHAIREGVGEVVDGVTAVVRNEKLQKDFLASFFATDSDRPGGVLGLISEPGSGVISRKIQEACRARLPGYMVPTYVLHVPFIPLSANNKADIKELRMFFNSLDPDQLMGTASSNSGTLSDDAMTGSSGVKLLKALRGMGLLGKSPEDCHLGSGTSIFDVGVDSVSVIRLSRALQREGLHATPALILRHPVLTTLVQALDKAKAATEASSAVESRLAVDACRHRYMALACETLGAHADEIEYIAPCSALQHGMLSRSRVAEHRSAYFNVFGLRLDGGVDETRLKGAWKCVFDACAVLRTQFVPTREGFVQVALGSASLHWVELPCGGDEALFNAREHWMDANQEVVVRPMELLFVPGKEKLLVLHIFHALYDAISLELLLDRVKDAYFNRTPLHVGPSFLDALVRGPLRNFGSNRAFWTNHLKKARFRGLPELIKEPAKQSPSVTRSISFVPLDTLCKSLKVTHSAIVQALWVSVLQSLHQADITIGTIVSGRHLDLENSDRIIGPLFNTLPFHATTRAELSWESLVLQCHEFNMSVLPFQHTPLRDIQKWCSGGQPLFDTLFSFQIQAAPSLDADMPWTQVESATYPDYPLALEATRMSDGLLHVLLVAKKEVADEATLVGLLENFEAAAAAMASNSQGLVHQSCNESTFAEKGKATVGQDACLSNEALEPAQGARPSFEWTPEATQLRMEMALLAGVAPDSIDEDTSLLELGLDSIDNIKLSARLRAGGIQLTPGQLAGRETVASLVKLLQTAVEFPADKLPTEGAAHVEALSASLHAHLASEGYDFAHVEATLPCTPLQESMVADMLESGFQRYFNHDILQLEPDVDISRLREAWRTVVQHSPILRTGFVPIDTPALGMTYCQIVRSQVEVFHEGVCDTIEDLDSITTTARVRAEAGQAARDLFQLTFAHISNKNYLVLSIAHALYDGWSLSLLHTDVRTAYHTPPSYTPRAPPTTHLGHMLLAATAPAATAFWTASLSGARPTPLPLLHPHPAPTTPSLVRAFAPATTPARTLKAFARARALSLLALGHAAWAAVLAARARALDVVFGAVLAGREAPGAEGVLFPVMNTVPVRVVVHGGVEGWLRYVQEGVEGAGRWGGVGLRGALRGVGGGSGSGRGRGGLFNSLFLLQKRPGEAEAEAGEGLGRRLWRSVGGEARVEVPVCVEMEVVGEAVVWRVACDARYVGEGDAAVLLHELDVVMEFLTSGRGGEVLAFGEEGVSVCGLPSFKMELENGEGGLSGEEVPVALGPEPQAEGAWSTVEAKVRHILARLSDLAETSISRTHMSIFHLGLDSISAIKACGLLRKDGVEISVRDMLKASSVADMAATASRHKEQTLRQPDVEAAVVQALAEVDADALLRRASLELKHVDGVLPATAMQVHVLSAWENAGGAVFYPGFRHRLPADVALATAEAAWARVVVEFPILRTVLLATGSRRLPFVQVTLPAEVVLEEIRVKPMVGFSVEMEPSGRLVFALKIHHALYDGVSLPIMLARFAELCAGAEASQARVEMASWRELVSLPLLETNQATRMSFWTHYLGGAKLAENFKPPATVSLTRRRISHFRPAAIPDISRLRVISSRHGISLQAVLFAAYARVLSSSHRVAGGDVLFGVYLANRGSDTKLVDAPFPTLCLVPLLVRGADQRELVDLATSVQRDLHDISRPEHVCVGLWEVEEWVGVRVDSFVNFLAVPEREAAGGRSEVLEELSPTEGNDAALGGGGEEGHLGPLQESVVKGAFPDAVDIEVAVRGHGMDIGVFGAAERLDENGARVLLDSIIDILACF